MKMKIEASPVPGAEDDGHDDEGSDVDDLKKYW